MSESPDCIPYFNQSVRGIEHKVLGDSNLDWGQDPYRLSLFLDEWGIEKIKLDYFGCGNPRIFGIESEIFDCQDRRTGWVAASVTALQGIYNPPIEWLADREP